MKNLSYSLKLLQEGFSLITVGENKIPNTAWKSTQSEQLTPTEFTKRFELPTTNAIGIVTGFDYLECIDVDLKVFSTKKEQEEFWKEYISFLQDNIYDFDDKFVIYKTMNNGYHILYKSKRVEGNKKIATLKGHKEAIIETRGIGGYIFVYEKSINDKIYNDIIFITDEDRDIIMSCSKVYNYINTEVITPEIKSEVNTNLNSKQPYQDYNEKTKIWDVISEGFTVVRDLKNKYIIKRHNATSPHSGYIYKDSGCMFLFSTGTIYPNEKLITPFEAITIKKYGGDFTKANSELYKEGYGDRFISETPKTIVENKIKVKNIEFPLDVFPEDIKAYLIICNKALGSSIEYMSNSLLWMMSIIIGNSIEIEVKQGWNEKAILWFALVGKAGIGKTPSINQVIFPLKKINKREVKKYIREYKKWEEYDNLSKEEKKTAIEVTKPLKTQFIVSDITIESLIDIHGQNQNSVGIFKDELAGWLKDMNKYRGGSDLEQWLSSWSNEAIIVNRKTSKDSYVDNAFMPVLGGIQPQILSQFYTEENKDNGFLDRLLLCFPELEVNEYSELEISYENRNWYDDKIVSFYEKIKKHIEYDDFGEIKPRVLSWSHDAKKEWIRIFNKITKQQNSHDINEYMKSMLPKQKTYIPRFALILNMIHALIDDKNQAHEITKKSILDAEKLSDYFVNQSHKIKIDSKETSEIKNIIQQNEGKSTYDKFTEVYKNNPDIKKSKLSEILEVSRTMIYKYIKKYQDENKKS